MQAHVRGAVLHFGFVVGPVFAQRVDVVIYAVVSFDQKRLQRLGAGADGLWRVQVHRLVQMIATVVAGQHERQRCRKIVAGCHRGVAGFVRVEFGHDVQRLPHPRAKHARICAWHRAAKSLGRKQASVGDAPRAVCVGPSGAHLVGCSDAAQLFFAPLNVGEALGGVGIIVGGLLHRPRVRTPYKVADVVVRRDHGALQMIAVDAPVRVGVKQSLKTHAVGWQHPRQTLRKLVACGNGGVVGQLVVANATGVVLRNQMQRVPRHGAKGARVAPQHVAAVASLLHS